MTLRKLLGSLGILLPIILVIGATQIPGVNLIQPSISDYYHTGMRDFFVSILTSFGLFLFTYTGYESDNDNLLTNFAGVFALFIAFFPTSIGEICDIKCKIHFFSATAFLLLMAYISYFLFTKSDTPSNERSVEKGYRNRIYRICAIVIIASIAILALYFAFAKREQYPKTTVFWLESLCLWAFGISWLVKGEAILGDRKPETKLTFD